MQPDSYPIQGGGKERTAKHCPCDTNNHGTELAMKVVRQARLELSGGSTPDQLKPPTHRRHAAGVGECIGKYSVAERRAGCPGCHRCWTTQPWRQILGSPIFVSQSLTCLYLSTPGTYPLIYALKPRHGHKIYHPLCRTQGTLQGIDSQPQRPKKCQGGQSTPPIIRFLMTIVHL